MNLSAVFTAVGNFTGLTRPAKDAADALENVKKKAGEIDSSMPSNGGKAGDGLKAIGTRAGELGDQMAGVGTKMTTGITLPIVGGLTAAGKQFQDFEITIVQAGQKAGASSEQMERMKQKAIDMGASTAFSASEAAGGLDILAAGGMNAEDAMVALEGVMLGAQASGEGLELTAGVVASAINAFGLEAKDAANVSDVLAQSANTTALDMQDLAMVMANAGEVGPRFGQSLEGVVAWAGRLKDMGVPAASAGTAIRQALVLLSAPTEKAAGFMEDLGIKVRDAEGNMLPIPELVTQFGMAFDDSNPKLIAAAEAAGLSGQEFKDMAMQAMFGAEGAKAMSLAISDGKPVLIDAAAEAQKMQQLQDGLAKTMGVDGAKAWIESRTEMGQFTAEGADAVTALTALGEASAGTAAEVGAVMAETQAMKWDEMMGSLETMAIELGSVMAPALKDVMSQLTEVVNGFTEWGKKNPELVQLGLKIALAAAAIGPLLVGVGKMVKLFGAMTKGVGAAVNGVQKFGSGLKWAFGKGAEGQASRFVRSFDTIRLRSGQAASAVASGAKRIASGFASMVSAAARATVAAVKWAAQMVAQAARAAAQFVVHVARVVAGWVLMGVQSLIHAAKMAAAWLIAMGPIAIVIAAVVGLVALIIANWDKVKKYTLIAWDAVVGALKAAWEWIKDTAKGVFDWIVGVVSGAWDAIKNGVSKAWDAVVGVLKAAWEGIKSAIKWYFETYAAIVKAVWDAIKGAAEKVWNGIASFLSGAWDKIKSVASTAWDGFKRVITAVWDAIKKFINERVEFWKNVLSRAWDAIKNAASTGWNTFKNTITAVWDAIRSFINERIEFWKRTLTNAWTAIKNAASTGWNNVKSAITGVWDKIKTSIDTAISNLKTALSNAWTAIKNTAETAWGKVKDKIAAPIRTVLDVVINKGLIAGYNWIARKVGASEIDPIKIGFREGGYTGRGPRDKIAGYVHADEQVIKSPSRRKFEAENPGVLDYINKYGELPQDHGPEIPQYRKSQLPQGGPSEWLGGVKDWFDGKITSLTDIGGRLLANMPEFGNTMIGDLMKSTATKLKDIVVAKIASIFGGDGFTGDGPALGGWRGMKAWMERQQGLGARVTSGFRPGAIAAGTGRASMHSLGRAIDIVGPNMRAIFQRIIQAYGVGKITELIYSPMGGQNIHRGSRYRPSAVTMGDHWDHVHWAMRRGGVVPGQGSGDRVPLLGEPGEFMVRRRAVRQAGVEALHALNAGRAAVVPIDFLLALSEREAGLAGSARQSVPSIGFASGWLRDMSSSTGQTGGNVITTHVYNPIGEPTEVSVNKRMQRLAAIGVL